MAEPSPHPSAVTRVKQLPLLKHGRLLELMLLFTICFKPCVKVGSSLHFTEGLVILVTILAFLAMSTTAKQ